MNLVYRAKQISMSPRTEWQVIGAEPTTPAQLFIGLFGISVPFGAP